MEVSLRNKSFFIDGAKFLSIIWSVLFFFQSNSIYYVAYESNFKKYIYALSVLLSIGSLFLILLYSLGHLDFFVRTFLMCHFFCAYMFGFLLGKFNYWKSNKYCGCLYLLGSFSDILFMELVLIAFKMNSPRMVYFNSVFISGFKNKFGKSFFKMKQSVMKK